MKWTKILLPKKKCSNKDCEKEFIPKNYSQKYCTVQCGRNHHAELQLNHISTLREMANDVLRGKRTLSSVMARCKTTTEKEAVKGVFSRKMYGVQLVVMACQQNL